MQICSNRGIWEYKEHTDKHTPFQQHPSTSSFIDCANKRAHVAIVLTVPNDMQKQLYPEFYNEKGELDKEKFGGKVAEESGKSLVVYRGGK